jgi:hypothetical protein
MRAGLQKMKRAVSPPYMPILTILPFTTVSMSDKNPAPVGKTILELSKFRVKWCPEGE